ncbi:MAG: dipeptide epimerase [Lentisphaerae bacterium]|nr:dipeptide epimerase [Lentisphaerota bacterium]
MRNGSGIREVGAQRLDIPLFEPFGISGGAQAVARNVLVTVELKDGTRGYGEAAPFPAFNGETQAGAEAAVASVRGQLEGGDVREWRALAALLRTHLSASGSARCAIETAVLDALTRQAGMPMYVFFGGVSQALETDMTVATGDAEAAASAARNILQRGISTIKVKIGAGDRALDLERLMAIRAAAPDAPLILDGNGGMQAEEALELTAALRMNGIVPMLLEQPVPGDDWQGMRKLATLSGIPVAADETASSAVNVMRLAAEGAAQVVNIKLMKAGVVEALDIVAVCRAAGLRLMIGSLVESVLGTTMSAHFAAGQGGFEVVDLDMPMFLAENPFVGGFVQHGARLNLAHIESGHGVRPMGDG